MVFDIILTSVSTILFAAAIVFTVKLSWETKGEKYWFFFIIAILSMFIFHIVRHPWFFSLFSAEMTDLIMELAEIIGAFSMAYATLGLYFSMKKIRSKMSNELDDNKKNESIDL